MSGLLTACPAGEPCAWSVTNETGESLVSMWAASTRGGTWRDDILAAAPLVNGERIVFDVDPGRYDLRGDGLGGDRYIVYEAAICEDGDLLESTLTISDREL